MKTIVLASNNKHKIKEIKSIFPNIEILTLNDIGYYEDIVEDGNTFLENALIKATTIHNYLKEKGLDYDILAEDSGLCCEGLDLAPGIYSARYAGDHNDQANRDKLIKELSGKDRTAYFICTVVYYKNDGTYINFEGKTHGQIIGEEKGNKDFGYDCIFLSNDLGKTFGEATNEEKNEVSHRYRAFIQLKDILK